MTLPTDVNLVQALLLLKRECMKVAGVKEIPTIIVGRTSLANIANAIDPSGHIYPDPSVKSIKFAGIDIVSEDIV